jgi:hypothetical protein
MQKLFAGQLQVLESHTTAALQPAFNLGATQVAVCHSVAPWGWGACHAMPIQIKAASCCHTQQIMPVPLLLLPSTPL